MFNWAIAIKDGHTLVRKSNNIQDRVNLDLGWREFHCVASVDAGRDDHIVFGYLNERNKRGTWK